MYRLPIPRNMPDVEAFIDLCIQEPIVRIPTANFSRNIGRITNRLRDDGVLGIYHDDRTGESIAHLKVLEATKFLGRGRNIEYVFGDKIKLPTIRIP